MQPVFNPFTLDYEVWRIVHPILRDSNKLNAKFYFHATCSSPRISDLSDLDSCEKVNISFLRVGVIRGFNFWDKR